MKKVILIYTMLLGVLHLMYAQSPKREMRATWMATVWQIDWPSNVITTTGNTSQINTQKTTMIRYLDSIKSANMNSVFLQVRSRCDAMYKSSYEPWSTDLVSTRGMDPDYDPLAFAVQEAHKRGLEIHAWLNPYRYATAAGQFSGPQDYRTTHPEWLLNYASGYTILNPGLPEVKQRITDIVKEIITNYDVDGIVFDDYFYAYGGTPTDLDLATQQLYKPADMNVHDWRRKNVNDMVLSVYTMIQGIKPYIKFGVGPFGIWTTDKSVAIKEDVPLPDGITGGNMYQEIYCDPISWLKQGSVDYVSPQLYWPTTSTGQDYDVLAPWWANVCLRFGKHFYSSQTLSGLTSYSAVKSNSKNSQKINAGNTETIELNSNIIPLNTLSPFEKEMILSKMNSSPAPVDASGVRQISENTAAVSPQEIGLQITRNRLSAKDNAPGSVFFSTNGLYTTGFTSYLKTYMFTNKSLTPAINWKETENYGLVSNLTVSGNTLTWNPVSGNVRYTVYAVPNSRINDPAAVQTSEFLKGVTYTNSFDVTNIDLNTFTLGVAVFDRFSNEFPVCFMGQTSSATPATTLLSPENGAKIVFGSFLPVTFSWSAVNNVYAYYFEISTDAEFQDVVFERELATTSISSSLIQELSSSKTYYWRVKTRSAGNTDGVSTSRYFVAQSFKITYPAYGQTDIPLEPTIKWNSGGDNTGTLYKLEISKTGGFDQILYSVTTSQLEATIPAQKLSSNSVYYARVTALNQKSMLASNIVMFKTVLLTPDTPVILLPNGNEGINGLNMHIQWNEDVRAASYRIEIARDPAFPPRGIIILNTPAYTYSIDYAAPDYGVYYIRVRADYGTSSYTEWSEVKMVDIKTGIQAQVAGIFKAEINTISHKSHKLLLELDKPGNTTIKLYSITGVELMTVQGGYLNSGKYSFPVSMLNYANGIYIVQIQLDSQKAVLKLIN